MKAIAVTDQAAGTAGMKLVMRPEPHAAISDVVVQIHASGFVATELAWPSTLVSVVGPPEARAADGLAVDFVVESDRAQLGEIVQRVRDGRVRTNIGNVATLDDAVAALNPTERRKGKTIIHVRP